MPHLPWRTCYLTRLLQEVRRSGDVWSGYAWAPTLWRLEVVNSLQSVVRRGRATPQFRNDTLADLEALPIRFDSETDSHVWGTTLELAIQHGLTIYDATYLELAKRRGLELATLDRELRVAAQAAGVALADF